MPTQFQEAIRALETHNTREFNELYGKFNTGRRSRPSSASRPSSPSQFEVAREALRASSPAIANTAFSEYENSRPRFGGKRRKTRKSKKTRKSRKASRRRR